MESEESGPLESSEHADAGRFVADVLGDAVAAGAVIDVLGGFADGRIDLTKSDVDVICRDRSDLLALSRAIVRHLDMTPSIKLATRRVWPDNQQWVLRAGNTVFMLDLMTKLAFQNFVLLDGPTYFELRDEGLDSQAIASFLKHATNFKKTRGVPQRVASLSLERPTRAEHARYLLLKSAELGRSLLARPEGLFVVVLGPDGSGKSTIIERLIADLATGRSMIPVRRFHWRPTLRDNPHWQANTAPHAKAPRSRAMSWAKMAFLLGTFNAGYVTRVMRPRHRFTVVVFDRYFHDLLVDPTRYRYGGPTWLARRVAKLVPQPDLWVILDAPAATLQARKQEVSFEETARQRAAYLSLARELPNAHVVDVDRSVDDIVSDVKSIVLDNLAARAGSQANLNDSPLVTLSDAATATHVEVKVGNLGRMFLPLDKRAQRAARNALLPPAKALLARLLVASRAGACETDLARELVRLAGFPGSAIAISLGASGPWRKDVAIVIDGDTPVAVAKVAVTRDAGELLSNEIRWLDELGRIESLAGLVPIVLQAGKHHGAPFLIQRMLHGPRPGPHLDRGVMALLSTIQDSVAVTRGYRGSAMQESLLDREQRLRHRVPAQWRERMAEACRHLERGLTAGDVPMVLAHRDFLPGNLRVTPMGVAAFDWEFARKGWGPLNDLFHYLLMPAALKRDLTAADARRALSDVRAAAGGLTDSSSKMQASAFQLLAYLLDLSTMFIDSWDGNVERSGIIVQRYAALIDCFASWKADV